MSTASDAVVKVIGHVRRTGARPTIHLSAVTVVCTRADVRIAEDGVHWEGTARVAATPDGVVLMLPARVNGLVVGDELEVTLVPTRRQARVPADVASELTAAGLPIERWQDPEVRHLVRWIGASVGSVRTERLGVLRSMIEHGSTTPPVN